MAWNTVQPYLLSLGFCPQLLLLCFRPLEVTGRGVQQRIVTLHQLPVNLADLQQVFTELQLGVDMPSYYTSNCKHDKECTQRLRYQLAFLKSHGTADDGKTQNFKLLERTPSQKAHTWTKQR